MTDAPTTPSPERQPADAGGGLLPCPWCGGEGWLNDYEARWGDMPPKSRCPQCRSCGANLGYHPTPAKAIAAWNRRAPAPQAQPDARAVEGEPVGYFLHNGHEWEEVANQFIGDPDVRPLYLSAPAADDGWRPSREEVIKAIRNQPGVKLFEDQFNVGQIADAILALHPAAPTDEVGKS